MIDGLDNLLADTGQPGLPELRRLLGQLFAAEGSPGRIVNVDKLLRSRVFRVAIESNGSQRSLVIKRLSPELATKERRVLERWLPRIGLDGCGPPLAGVAAEPTGLCVWHVYEDLGVWTLDQQLDNRDAVRAATSLVAELHQRGAKHPVLAECRASGSEFGSWFYESSVRDAIRNLSALTADPRAAQTENRQLIDRMLARLDKLWAQREYRAAAMAEFGGPETLVHGDLWTTNIFVTPGERLIARMIDFDHIGVGQVCYDLSTYLLRFPIERRPDVLTMYRQTSTLDWELPPPEQFNLLCETAEYARLTMAATWSAINARDDATDWPFQELAEIERWFDAMQPILPNTDTGSQNTVVAASSRSA